MTGNGTKYLDMKQLELPIEWTNCRYYSDCDAPLCPEDTDLKQCLWFPNEPVCRLKSAPEWAQKQKKIARLEGIDIGKYFTVKMLNAVEDISGNLEGIDSELYGGEKLWLSKRSAKRKKDITEYEFKEDIGNYPMF